MSAQLLERSLRWFSAIVILASAACREQVVVGSERAIDAGVVDNTEGSDAAGSDTGDNEDAGDNEEMVSEQDDNEESDNDGENLDAENE